MSNRFLKILLFFVTIFALQGLILVFLMLNPLQAKAKIGVRIEPKDVVEAGTDYSTVCECGYKEGAIDGESGKKETVRLFIPIPGVTDSCGYVCDITGDGKANVTDYIVAVYKFLVGLAAIVALIMVMWGGYSWIFAMGNTSKIEGAKDTIKSALLGLVLAMVSVQLLEMINPRLTDVGLSEVEKIVRQERTSIFCRATDIVQAQDGTVLLGSDSSLRCGEQSYTRLAYFDPQSTTEKVKVRLYQVAVEDKDLQEKIKKTLGDQNIDIDNVEFKETRSTKSACFGKECSSGNICFTSGGVPECVDPKKVCENQSKGACEDFNEYLANLGYNGGKQCIKRVDDAKWYMLGIGSADECVWGRLLQCPPGSVFVSAQNLFTEDHKGAKGICYEKDQDRVVLKDCNSATLSHVSLYPSYSNKAVEGAQALCCKYITDGGLVLNKEATSKTFGEKEGDYAVIIKKLLIGVKEIQLVWNIKNPAKHSLLF